MQKDSVLLKQQRISVCLRWYIFETLLANYKFWANKEIVTMTLGLFLSLLYRPLNCRREDTTNVHAKW